MPQFEQVEVFSSLIFWSILSFGILFFLLKRYAFPPILEALDDREKKIRSEIGEAEKLKQDAETLRAQLQQDMANAHQKAETIVQMASDEAKKIQEKTVHDTLTKVKQLQKEAEQEIIVSRNKLLSEIRGYTAALTIASTEKFLKKTMDDADKKKLVDESIEEVIRELESRRS